MTVRIQNFNPVLNYPVAGTNTSSAVVIAQPLNTTGGGSYGNSMGYTDVQFVNPNAFMAFAAWSMGTATAATTNAPLPPNSTIVYNMGQPSTSIAVILGSATTGNVYVSVGEGL